MWASIFASILSILSSIFGAKRDRQQAEATKEMVKNTEAHEEVKRQDAIEEKIEQASNGDAQALEDLRKAAAG